MRFYTILLIIQLLSGPVSASAEESSSASGLDFIPGRSRTISNELSASRDNGYPAWHYNPRFVQKGGIEFAVLGYGNFIGSLRFSFMGFMELESNNNDAPPYTSAEHNVAFWRGHFGYGISQTVNSLSELLFSRKELVELYLGWRHESDHFTGDEAGDSNPREWDIPNVGDWIHVDEAVRIPLGRLHGDLRFIQKYYIPVEGNRAYRYALAGDLIIEWDLFERAHPYSSSFAEYMKGNEYDIMDSGIRAGVPDAKFFYQHFGISFKGKIINMNVFTLLSYGNGKGYLIYDRTSQWGWGVSITLN